VSVALFVDAPEALLEVQHHLLQTCLISPPWQWVATDWGVCRGNLLSLSLILIRLRHQQWIIQAILEQIVHSMRWWKFFPCRKIQSRKYGDGKILRILFPKLKLLWIFGAKKYS